MKECQNNKLFILEKIDGEIAHYYSPIENKKLFSKANKFWGTIGGCYFSFFIPLNGVDYIATRARLLRRLARTDKSSAVFNASGDGVTVLYRGLIYFYDLKRNALLRVGALQQCRNVLHGGIAVTKRGLFFGEYGANPDRLAVPVWGSFDDGRSWTVIHHFKRDTIKHVHGVCVDPWTDSLWIPTGDFQGECYLYEVPEADFSCIRRYGDGKQEWRPVRLLFDENRIVWGMDSQLQTSHLQVFNRGSCALTQGRDFPGPIWYSKQFNDGSAILQTTVEIGPGSRSDDSYLYASENLTEWSEVGRFHKDIFPKRYFKFGVIAFADGEQSGDDFVIFGEALQGLDGRILRVCIQ